MDESEKHEPAPAKRRWRRGAATAIVVLIAAGAPGLWVFRWERSTPNELVLYGNVDIREVDLAFNESNRIVAMYVEEGEPVEAGQLLAELDASELEHTVREAEAKVAAQRAVVARFEHGSRPEEIGPARSEVRAAEAELAVAKATHERQEELVKAHAAPQQLEDDSRAAHLAAQARLEVARENLRLAIEGPRREDTEAARAQLRADENALAFAKHRLSNTKLYAPATGTVLTRILEPGSVVLPNTPVYTLALLDPIWVRAYLSEPDLGRVFPGMKAEIVSDSFPDRSHDGWVGFISSTAEFTPKPVETPDLRTSLVYRMRIYVRNPDHTLRQGMPVTVHLRLDQTPASVQGETRPHPEPVTGEQHGVQPSPSETQVPETSASRTAR